MKRINNQKKLYLLNRNTGKLLSCWRIWLCKDETINNKSRKRISQICREGLTTGGIKAMKDILDDVDFINGAPSSQWRICWINMDAASVTITNEDNQETNIYLLLI